MMSAPQGELSAERLGDIWMDVQRESLGPVFRFHDEYRNYWAYIPHFVHAPFYVYAYAFGDCLVNSLYGVFAGGHAEFQAKYLDMLAAGRHAQAQGVAGAVRARRRRPRLLAGRG